MYSLIIHRRAVACIAVALPALDSTSYTCKSSVSDSSVRPLPIPVNPRRETTAHKNAALASLTIMILSEAWTHAYTWDFMKLVVSASCDQTGKVSSRSHNAPRARNHEQMRLFRDAAKNGCRIRHRSANTAEVSESRGAYLTEHATA